ncbi:MAG: TldD/PmbA family protein [Candidatus Cryptobacteroides sp.]
MILPLEYYKETFGVTEKDLDKLTALSLNGEGDYSDLYFENTSTIDLLLRDGEVSSGGFHIDYGVGIRTLKGDKTGYAYAESTDPASMNNAAKAASAITTSSSGSIGEPVATRPFRGRPNPEADRYRLLKDWRDCESGELVPVLRKLQELVLGKDPRIIKVIGMLSSQVSDILMYNSYGEMKYETRPLGTLALSVIFSDGKSTRNSQVSRSYRMGAEMLTDSLLEEIACNAVKNIDDRFAAKRPKGGKMPVVMGAGASGILLHEAMGHAFEADFNRKGQSIFAGKVGQVICNENISIVDDGTVKFNRGSLNFDDEGVPAQRTYMVKDGVLTSYLHDRISARYYDVQPTGNGRRESFRYNPIPRMRATYMESGNSEPESIIASVKKGIYVDEFANGQVKIGEGDFTFYVKSGYMIENGKLTQPINDINITGNGPQALADIVAVGNDGKIDDGAWTCGKEQSVPVSCGIPTVLVNNLTVGGN